MYDDEPAPETCKAKSDMACAYYDTKADCIGTPGVNVSINRTYTGLVPVGGDHTVLEDGGDAKFHFGRCQWDDANVACIKNSDDSSGDPLDDCGPGARNLCLQDVQAPTTELFIVEGTTYTSKELHDGNFFSVHDEEDDFFNANGDRMDPKTFARFCLYNPDADAPCYPADTYNGIGYKGRPIIPSGDYILRYYSLDASNNLERINETGDIIHVLDSGIPGLFRVYVNGERVMSNFVTRFLRPDITLEFDRGVTIDDNFPVLDKNGGRIRMTKISENAASTNFTFRPTEFLSSGLYSVFVEFRSKANPLVQNQDYGTQFTVVTTTLNIVALDPVVYGDKVLSGTDVFDFVIDVNNALVGDCFVGPTPDAATVKMDIGNTSTRRKVSSSRLSSAVALAHDGAGGDVYLNALTTVWVKCMLRPSPLKPEEPNYQKFSVGIDSSPPASLTFDAVPSRVTDYGSAYFHLNASSDDRLACTFFNMDPLVNASLPLGTAGSEFDAFRLTQGPSLVGVEFIGDLPPPENVASHALKYNVSCRNLVGRTVTGQAQVTVDFSQIIKMNVTSPLIIEVPPDGIPVSWSGSPAVVNVSTDKPCKCSGSINGNPVSIAGLQGFGNDLQGYTRFSAALSSLVDGRNNLTVECQRPAEPGIVTKSFTFKYDGASPNNVQVRAGTTGCARGEISAAFAANDTVSGVSNFTISLWKGTKRYIEVTLAPTGVQNGSSVVSYLYKKGKDGANDPIEEETKYTWMVVARDNAGNKADAVAKDVFQDARDESCRVPLKIKVKVPRLGISALSPNFDVIIETNRTAECRWHLWNQTWEQMTGIFAETPMNASLEHKFFWTTNVSRDIYVKCYDGQGFLHDGFVFIDYDPTAPVYQRFDVLPNPVIDPMKKISQVFLETDQDPVFCRCAGDSACMVKTNKTEDEVRTYTPEDQFLLNYTDLVHGFGTNTEFRYVMTCSNGADPADRSIATRRFNVTVNLVDGVIIELLEPGRYTRQNTGQVRVRTNIQSVCSYKKENDSAFTSFSGEGTEFSASIGAQSEGDHRITIQCKAPTKVSIQEFPFTVDSQAPTNVTVKINDPQCSLRTIRANVSAIDSGVGLENFTYQVSIRTDIFEEVIANSSVRANRTAELRYDGALQSNATYYWKVTAVDKAGNPSGIATEDVRVYDPKAVQCDFGKPKGTLKKRFDDAQTNVTVLCADAESGCTDTFKYTKAALAERCSYQSQETIGRFLPLNVKTRFCFAVYDLFGNNASYSETVDVYDVPEHCSNGEKDANESDIDCGGVCIPCQAPECGDGMVNRQGEDCDLLDFGRITGCTDTFFFGAFGGGTLRCTDKCKMDTSRCTGEAGGSCKDDAINPKESCEPGFFKTTSCKSIYSFAVTGNISCKNCNIDTTACKYPGVSCQKDSDCMSKVCDKKKGECALPSCTDGVRNGDEGGVDCGGSCEKKCEVGKCGDGKVNAPGEVCDGRDFGSLKGCTDDVFKAAFTGGNLTCTIECKLSTNSCAGGVNGTCGNNVINLHEACDPPSGIVRSCVDLYAAATGGDVFCASACNLDSSLCEFMGVGCRSDDDCVSGSCSDGACIEGSCADQVVNGDESDADCGGSCEKCADWKGCKRNDDCVSGFCDMEKVPHTCVANPDSDHDGIPDKCELEWGLDMNDGKDAYLDPDNDGLNDKEEYAVSLRFNRTGACIEAAKINNPDSDGDGFTDGIEVERGYDPMNKNSHPPKPNEEDPLQRGDIVEKTPLIAIIFLIVGIVLVLGGGGFLGYERFRGKRSEPPRTMANAPPRSYDALPRVESVRPSQQKEPQPKVVSPDEMLARKRIAKEREALRKKMRSSLMSKFEKEEK
jgi:hypothetical protein